jgi:MscS family membrane protein
VEIGYTYWMKYLRSPLLYLLFWLFFGLASLHGGKYNPWIEQQIALISQSMDDNLTQSQLKELISKRDKLYSKAIEEILLNKDLLQKENKKYEKEIFTLQKMIAVNKRRGNKSAVLRDEIQMKSYRLLQLKNQMIRKIFSTLDSNKMNQFSKKVYEIFAQNQSKIEALDDPSYKKLLNEKPTNSITRQIQQNIREFYALKEISADIIRYFSDEMKKVYRLNQYAKYNILRPVLYINHISEVQAINHILEPYGLSVVKLLLMLLVSLVIFFIRKVLTGLLEYILIHIKFIGRYAQEVLDDVRTPLSILWLVINLELLLFIYHDFSSYETVSKIFNILYTGFITFFIFKALNSIARVKLEHLDQSKKKIKSELFNITVKIINVIVIIIGFLFALYFAGVNLTAVLSGLGIGGFAVALAARESLSNFFGTLSILMSEVFSQGDWIEVDGKEGNVVEIGLRITTIRTFDNALIAIPNATLANKEVKNWSKRLLGRRIKMQLAVKYDSKREDLQRAIDEIRQMLREHPGIATEKTMYQDRSKKSAKLVSKEDELGVKRTLLVYLDEFADSSINILVYTFSKSTVWRDWLETKEDVMYKLMEILERNNLAFAFPTITIDQPDEEK